MWIRSTKAFNMHWKNQESRKLALKEQQYQILKAKDTRALGTSLLIIPEPRVLVLTKRYVGSGNEIGEILCESNHSNKNERNGRRVWSWKGLTKGHMKWKPWMASPIGETEPI